MITAAQHSPYMLGPAGGAFGCPSGPAGSRCGSVGAMPPASSYQAQGRGLGGFGFFECAPWDNACFPHNSTQRTDFIRSEWYGQHGQSICENVFHLINNSSALARGTLQNIIRENGPGKCSPQGNSNALPPPPISGTGLPEPSAPPAVPPTPATQQNHPPLPGAGGNYQAQMQGGGYGYGGAQQPASMSQNMKLGLAVGAAALVGALIFLRS